VSRIAHYKNLKRRPLQEFNWWPLISNIARPEFSSRLHQFGMTMAQKKSSMVIAPQAKQINGEQSDKNNCRSVTVHQFVRAVLAVRTGFF